VIWGTVFLIYIAAAAPIMLRIYDADSSDREADLRPAGWWCAGLAVLIALYQTT